MGRTWAALLLWGAAIPALASHGQIFAIPATTLRISGPNLVAGMPDGGVCLIEASDGVRLLNIPGDGNGATNDARWIDSHIWWTCAGSDTLHVLKNDLRTSDDVDLGIGPLERVSEWGDYVVGYSHRDFRFVDKWSHRVFTPARVLGTALAEECSQGQVTTSWANGKGILFLVRRYGKHEQAAAGSVADIALVNAWDKDLKLLGGHTCSLFSFQDESGPDVTVDMGPDTHHSPYGWTALGNLSVSDIGMVALGQSEAEAVPFGKTNWESQHLKLPVDPGYNQTLCEVDSTAWWTDGIKLFRASLEDGQTDVFLPRQKLGKVQMIAAGTDTAYALTESGIERIDPSLFVEYSMGEQDTASDVRLTKLSQVMARLDRKKVDSETYVTTALQAVGVSAKEISKLPTVDGESLRYGDLVTESGLMGIYIGKGLVKYGPDYVSPIALTDQTRIVRLFSDNVADASHSLIHAVGLGHPYFQLGHSDFVQITHDTQYDQPYLPEHQRMADTIESFLGTPYRWGGNGYGGIDCSGFVCAVFRSIGVSLPRYSQSIGKAKIGFVVKDQLKYGDVLVYSWPHKHCAIYVGNGNVVEAISCGVTMHQLTGHPFGIVRRFISDVAAN